MTGSNAEYESYALLSQEEREPFGFEDEGNPSGAKHARVSRSSANGHRAWLPWVLALLLVVAATDAVTLLYISRIMDTVYADLSTDELEFANPYHGLDALYRSGTIESSKIDPIQNIPRVVAQVFPGRPKELAPVGEHDLFNKAFGTLSPHEKHLQVSPDVHTIAQFRALDFGMEECSLVIQLPGNGDHIESKEPFLFHPLSVFEVFRPDAPKPLDVRKLSYSTRPPRKEKIATVTPRAGEETPITRFPCAWGTLHTFEVACGSTSDCLVDIWSSQNTTYGIYMYQHQTV
ncbi:hypothetical protein L226DRAFT_259130 [Lentinus tigrinus ALCF2SS1-7]|uniref:Ubiquitin 3 binding protein But2 C-terminal domain-containing protein n=1 Tax=Lentinus tigrinus ALCF2SS1-6 TaxID=1328759 RepID=A0A5C2RMI7_9APHY|nr:hypothetical protein L227DRAFT_582106 [Lentinus tigrinus ALCF2SS1-6]RPD69982.1 hypothetical protein L226DRAFT_259130 [Lentinus tigrinus ALCF2SS1-7]